MLNLKEWIAKVTDSLTTKTRTISWGGTTVYFMKTGHVVTISIYNPRTVAAGNNTIETLPEEWRPKYDCAFVVIQPANAAKCLRYTVSPAGTFAVYNYAAAWTNTDSNVSGSFTYITP